jgi:hypothetical protein
VRCSPVAIRQKKALNFLRKNVDETNSLSLSLPYQLCLVILLFIVWLMPHQHRRSHHPLLYWRQLGQMVERERRRKKEKNKHRVCV